MGEKIAYIMIGVPGSGKSTHARNCVRAHDVEVIEIDSCRDQIFGGMDLGSGSDGQFSGQAAQKNQMVHGVAIGMCIQILKSGRSVVHDGTNTNPEMRQVVIEALRPHADRVICIWIRTSRENCLQRNALREGDRRVPKEVIEKKFMEVQKIPPKIEDLEVDELIVIET